MTTTLESLTEEQLAKLVDSVEKQRLYRKEYNLRNKDKVRAYHRAYNERRRELITQLKAQNLI